ncbi:MAG: phosphatase [Desulfobacter sp.]|nr:MAG: phosphatase [Desulfobacter sp.]
MKRIKGDLIKLAQAGEFDVIIHGCNCFCAMDAGIARQIRGTFPKAWQADRETPAGDRQKLGHYSWALINNRACPLVVVNGYTQFHYEGDGVLADYQAIELLFTQLKGDFSGKRFGYPKIGAGLAGGDWAIIGQIIEQALAGEDHTLVEHLTE